MEEPPIKVKDRQVWCNGGTSALLRWPGASHRAQAAALSATRVCSSLSTLGCQCPAATAVCAMRPPITTTTTNEAMYSVGWFNALHTQNLHLPIERDGNPVGLRRAPLELVDLLLGGIG